MGKNIGQLMNLIIVSLSFVLWTVEDNFIRIVMIAAAIALLLLIFIAQTDWFILKFLRKNRPSFMYLGKWEGILSYERFGGEKDKKISMDITYHNGDISVKTNIIGVQSSTIAKAIYSEIENSLMYTYISKPKNLSETSLNPIHYGAVLLKLTDKENIQGNYFTSRKSDGQIIMKKVGTGAKSSSNKVT